MTEIANNLSIEALQFYQEHPVEACKDLLKVELDTWQQEATRSLFEDHFVAIRAGSGVGKSEWASDMAMLFLGTRPFSIIPTTAPSQHQLNDVLWGKHYRAIQRSEYLQELTTWTQTKVAVKGFEPSWYAVARTARVAPDGTVAEGLQGFHSPELLFIVDEASGVDDPVFAAIEGALTEGNAYVILISNPTKLVGYFYEIFRNPRLQQFWKTFHVSCYDSKYVDERYIRMMEAKWGKDHPIFQIKVLGEFPTSDILLMFPPDDIEKMRNNSFDFSVRGGQKKRPYQIGIDIGWKINKSIACTRYENIIHDWAELDLKGTVSDGADITSWAVALISAFNPESVVVDAVGVGAIVYSNLVRMFPKIVHPFYGQAKPAEDKRNTYANLRAQAHWDLREILRSIYCVKLPDKFVENLQSIRYEIKNGKVLVESKEKMKESPDYSDAAVMAFVDPGLCKDDFNVIHSPYMIKGTNEDLKKENIWTMEPRVESRFERRFGILDG